MKKILRTYINVALIITLIGGIVFTAGFGICLNMSRNQITDLTNKAVMRDMDVIHTYIDGQLHIIEGVAHSLCWAENSDYAIYSKDDFNTKEDIFVMLENVLLTHPNICGAAVGFEKSFYSEYNGPYGFACYVTNVTGKIERLQLGDIHDFHQKEWYSKAFNSRKAYWCLPFRETSSGAIVTCYCLPLTDSKGNYIGILALDINTDKFRKKCNEMMPFAHAKTALVDRELNFFSHPDTTYLFRKVAEVETSRWDENDKQAYATNYRGVVTLSEDGSDVLFYFDKVKGPEWIICIECPYDEVYAELHNIAWKTTIIAILSILLMIACFVFLYRRLLRTTQVKASMESDMKVASNLQMSLLPKTYPAFPERKEIDIYGYLKPAKTVGGDLYDYVIRDNKLFFLIGDVSGKGVPAAMFMSVVTTYCHHKSRTAESAAEIVSSLNSMLASENKELMFCTFFLGILDLTTGHLDYCNAGHDAPILIRSNDGTHYDIAPIEVKTNLAVGIMEDFPYVEESITLKPGDTLFLYTDGVSEAENEKKELFGTEATIATLNNIFDSEPSAAVTVKIERMLDAIHRHANGTTQNDDITMVMLEYKA